MAIIASPRGLADDWLELDHARVRVLTQHSGVEIGSDDMGRPLIFETVVVGGHDDLWVRRYATESEARAGHAIVLAIYGAGHTLRGLL
jgi:hypothetical protein